MRTGVRAHGWFFFVLLPACSAEIPAPDVSRVDASPDAWVLSDVGLDATMSDTSVADNGDTASGIDALDVTSTDVPVSDTGMILGTPCAVRGVPGVCTYTTLCSDGGVATPGFCPGPSNVQCCTAGTPPLVDGSTAGWDAIAVGCPSDMAALPGYCMDRYEAPNVQGAMPLAMQTAPDGERWCAARGKRLCTEAEWVMACEGARGYNEPYGPTYVARQCDDDKTWIAPNWTTLGLWPSSAAMAEAMRLYQADPSGMRTGCRSEEGVMDMTGNVAEWVERSFPNANNYAQVMKGCYWSGCYGGSNPSCSFVNPAHPGTFRTYEAGFRCCLTP